MRELQAAIIREMGVKPEIDPAREVADRVQFLIDYATRAHTRSFVLGISGGVDSTAAGRLAQLAVERMGDGARFFAVRLPYGVQHDEADAQEAMDFIAATDQITLNIEAAVDGMEAAYEHALDEPITDFNKGNAKARARMVAQYAIAGDNNALVVGTDQAAESTMGFFTKFGDGGADILPLFGLNKRQVRALSREMGAPESLWNKVPTADLLDHNPGRPDEDEMGVSYDAIDDYLEGREVPTADAERIEQTWLRSRHKRTTPATILDAWWRN